MTRKRTFSDRRSNRDELWGAKKRSLSLPELDERPASRKRSRQSEGNGPSRPLPPRAPRSPRRGLSIKAKRARGIIILVSLIAIGFLIWFFVSVYPSPIGACSPEPDSCTNNKDVRLEVSFKKPVEPGQVELIVNDSDVTGSCNIEGNKLTCGDLDLQDGEHTATVKLDSGGLMGKRGKKWSFTVDTTPPDLRLTEKQVNALEGTDEVNIKVSGETDQDAKVEIGGNQVDVDPDGNFQGGGSSTCFKSMEVSAIDGAGNRTSTYVVTQRPVQAKGAHVSEYIASSGSDMDDMIDMVNTTELNSLEIDIKDEAGQLGFELDYPLAQEINSVNDYFDLDEIVDSLRYDGIYTICRIVVFKDPKLASERPNLAVKSSSGSLWGRGQWVDPYSKEVWDYNLAVAEAAAKAGFQEIQFDYIRFPSDGDVTTCIYPSQDDRNPKEVITGFLSYARNRLARYNVFISADLFGLTASEQGEMGIGQSVRDIAEEVDYLCPMMYPSHYAAGEYGIKNPESNPGDTVANSVDEFKKTLEGTTTGLRPWLQDFSLAVTYTSDMVRRQIDSCEERGVNEWLLWDPNCTYSKDALKPSQ